MVVHQINILWEGIPTVGVFDKDPGAPGFTFLFPCLRAEHIAPPWRGFKPESPANDNARR